MSSPRVPSSSSRSILKTIGNASQLQGPKKNVLFSEAKPVPILPTQYEWEEDNHFEIIRDKNLTKESKVEAGAINTLEDIVDSIPVINGIVVSDNNNLDLLEVRVDASQYPELSNKLKSLAEYFKINFRETHYKTPEMTTHKLSLTGEDIKKSSLFPMTFIDAISKAESNRISEFKAIAKEKERLAPFLSFIESMPQVDNLHLFVAKRFTEDFMAYQALCFAAPTDEYFDLLEEFAEAHGMEIKEASVTEEDAEADEQPTERRDLFCDALPEKLRELKNDFIELLDAYQARQSARKNFDFT